MVIVGVKFRSSGKVYYFDPNGIEFKQGEGVITETARGKEYGTIAIANSDVSESSIVSPLKPVLRKATEKDEQQDKENLAKRIELIKTTTRKVTEHKLVLKVVDAEYTFDRSKVIIYFTADGRVDFRDLVKDLAGIFHVRIELRQIYERDDIKMRGALAVCGRPCCCTTFLRDFEKVSMKMAKIQGLSPNPQKISGCCGKLMCCLKYEYPFYNENFKKMPKINSVATTPDGNGTVNGYDILRGTVKVYVELADGSREVRNYPLEQVNAKEKQNIEEVTDDPGSSDDE